MKQCEVADYIPGMRHLMPAKDHILHWKPSKVLQFLANASADTDEFAASGMGGDELSSMASDDLLEYGIRNATTRKQLSELIKNETNRPFNGSGLFADADGDEFRCGACRVS